MHACSQAQQCETADKRVKNKREHCKKQQTNSLSISTTHTMRTGLKFQQGGTLGQDAIATLTMTDTFGKPIFPEVTTEFEIN